MRSELVGLNGGRKNLWIKNHKQEILEYYCERGLYLTLTEFNLQYDTFDRFIRGNISEIIEVKKPEKFSGKKMDARMKILENSIKEIDIKQRKLVNDFNKFVPSVAGMVSRKLYRGIAAGLLNTLEDDSDPLPDEDLLSLYE